MIDFSSDPVLSLGAYKPGFLTQINNLDSAQQDKMWAILDTYHRLMHDRAEADGRKLLEFIDRYGGESVEACELMVRREMDDAAAYYQRYRHPVNTQDERRLELSRRMLERSVAERFLFPDVTSLSPILASKLAPHEFAQILCDLVSPKDVHTLHITRGDVVIPVIDDITFACHES